MKFEIYNENKLFIYNHTKIIIVQNSYIYEIVYEQFILVFLNFTFYKRTMLKLFFIYIPHLFCISSHYLACIYKQKLFL